MLVITRRRGQAIQLDFGDQTALIEVLEFRGSRTVKLGVHAARSVRVVRLAPGFAPKAANPTERVATEGGSISGAGEAMP